MAGDDRVIRRLAAILAADMVGYSRLIGEDESGTIRRQQRYQREVVYPLIAAHRGRVFKTMGDGLLAEFASVVDAVRFAIEFQSRILEVESSVPEHRRIRYRVGVNLGDVVLEGDDILGDGVNVAARLEALANPGEVLISGSVFDQLEHKLDYGYRFHGRQALKHIIEPQRVYTVLADAPARTLIDASRRRLWPALVIAAAVVIAVAAVVSWRLLAPREEAASIAAMALPLPDKPSIAVMPFANLSGDDQSARIAEAFTQDTNFALSKLSQFLVMASDATKSLEGPTATPKRVAEALGVRYVLQGAIEREGQRLRVGVRLTDAVSGRIAWSERFDHSIDDLFDVRDEVILNVASEVGATISAGERDRILRRGTDSLDAWLLVREAAFRISLLAPEHVKPAETMARRAIALDPDYAEAYAALAGVYRQWGQNWPGQRSREELFALAAKYGRKALELDPENDYANLREATLRFAQGQHDDALRYIEKAVSLVPNNWINHGVYGWILNHADEPKKAYSHLKIAVRLNPSYPYWVLREIGHSQQLLGKRAEALATLRSVLAKHPDRVTAMLAYVRSAIMLHEDGDIEMARALVAKAREVFPSTSIAFLHESRPYKDPAIYRAWDPILVSLGLPDGQAAAGQREIAIAVLPFVSLADAGQQDYLSRGLALEIFTDLSKISAVLLAAWEETSRIDPRTIALDTLRAQMKIDYALTGDVLTLGDKVRVSVRLVDARTDRNQWSESYDREIKDIFSLIDDISEKVIASLTVELTDAEKDRLLRPATQDAVAYDLLLRARAEYLKWTPDSNAEMLDLYRQAIARDENFAQAYAESAHGYFQQWILNGGAEFALLDRGLKLAKQAVAIAPNEASTHSQLGWMHLWRNEHEQAIDAQLRALTLDPNSADTLARLAETYLFSGDPATGLRYLARARQRTRFEPFFYGFWAGECYYYLEQLEEAARELEGSIRKNPRFFPAHRFIAAVLAEQGRVDDARRHVAEALALNPQLSLSRLERVLPFKRTGDLHRQLRALRKAGLPE